jgi:hypothetical protein
MIIALTGYCYDDLGGWGTSRAGKSTIAERLEELGGLSLALADPMKDFVGRLFGWPHSTLYGSSELREIPDERYVDDTGCPVTPRKVLMLLGTEWGRHVCPTIWLQYLEREAKKHQSSSIVVTDVRFCNEVVWLRERGAIIVRIKRRLLRPEGCSMHVSETELLGLSDSYFDAIIEGRNVSELRTAVTAFWNHLQ